MGRVLSTTVCKALEIASIYRPYYVSGTVLGLPEALSHLICNHP